MDPNQPQGHIVELTPGDQPGYVPAPGPMAPAPEGWAQGVYTTPVSRRSRRLRWGIAGAVILCVVLVTAAGAFVLSGAAGSKSLTASVAPKNTIAFMEIRTDLPGDQHAKLAQFMSHFPGFKDQSEFDTALDQLLNRLTGAVSPDLTYTSAFKPWMEGEVSIAVTDLGSTSGSASATPAFQGMPGESMGPDVLAPGYGVSYQMPGAVAIVALKDRSAAQTWISSELTQQNVRTTSQTYSGTQLYTIGTGTTAGAYALTSQDLLLGTVDAVKAAIDTKTQGSLADNSSYQSAMNSFSGDSLARFYINARAMVGYELDSYNSMMSSLGSMDGGASSPMPTLPISENDVPAWVAGSVRAESNQMVVNVVMPRTGVPSAGNHTSKLASVLPGDTVGVMEVHSIGKLVTSELATIEAKMPGDSSLKSVNDALAQYGGIDWLGDGVAAVTQDGSTYGGGIVVQAQDAATATAKVTLVQNLLTLAGGSTGLTSRDETYKGVDITVLTVSSNPISTVGAEEVAFAATGNVIVAGYTDAFVKSVIDTTPATSLASQSDYSAVMNAVGSSNEESFYVDIPALADQIGQAALGSSASTWTTDYKPYVDHLGGVGYAVIDGNTVIMRFVVTAK